MQSEARRWPLWCVPIGLAVVWSLRGALHAPRAFPGLSRLGALLETAGRAVPRWGAFQVLVIDKDRHS